METEPLEFRQVKKISGGSANLWVDFVFLGMLVTLLTFVFLLILYALSPQRMTLFMLGVVYVFLGFLVADMVVAGISQLQFRRELARGYTSLPSGNANAAQIDPKTGAVIREPGEAFLPKLERLRRTALARAQASRSA